MDLGCIMCANVDRDAMDKHDDREVISDDLTLNVLYIPFSLNLASTREMLATKGCDKWFVILL